jgi:hypothetical protein
VGDMLPFMRALNLAFTPANLHSRANKKPADFSAGFHL